MTKKNGVDLTNYKKAPRSLRPELMDALMPGGGLHPVLAAVKYDGQLCLEIRDGRFNVYYCGGSLLCVDGRKKPWEMGFDDRYFPATGTRQAPTLPDRFRGPDDALAWVKEFPGLKDGMRAWWNGHSRDERRHCLEMARANSAMNGLPTSDFCVLDLEYQWAQRRFDLIAARRRITAEDPTGWVEPALVFIEVKSDARACADPSGLADHAKDFRSIVEAPRFQSEGIRQEFKGVIEQKLRLGLLHRDWPFRCFAAGLPLELLVVFVGVDPRSATVYPLLAGVSAELNVLGGRGDIRSLRLDESDFVMRERDVVPWSHLTRPV